jgi:hypothetical protein
LAIGRTGDLTGWDTRHRLVLNSCLEDGEFTRYLFKNHFGCCASKLEACLDVAQATGDLVMSPVGKRNRLLFAHHLACMIAIMHLPERPVIDYEALREELLDEAVWFALRGMGLAERAIASHYNPKALSLFLGIGKE